MQDIGKYIFIGGMILSLIGLALWLLGDKLPLGRLPGDVNVSRPGFSFHFPVVTCLILSAVLSLLMWLIGKWRQ